MNIGAIIAATVLVAAVGLFIGVFLGVAGKKFAVEVDEKEVAVREALPGNNCGGCGYPGCDGLAAAIAKGEAPVNGCPVGGEPVGKVIAAIMGQEVVEYTYQIYNSRLKDPFYVNRAWFYPRHLDENVMQAAANQFVGTHDFAAVRSVGTDVKSTVRTVYYYNVERQGELVTLRVCANGFLYNMARAMAGTVVYAAEGKIRPEEIGEILASGNRTAAGPTVPAGGLYMTRLWYDDGIEKFEVGSDGTR